MKFNFNNQIRFKKYIFGLVQVQVISKKPFSNIMQVRFNLKNKSINITAYSRTESSAQVIILAYNFNLQKSLIKMIKSRGPKIEPWGTPQFEVEKSLNLS